MRDKQSLLPLADRTSAGVVAGMVYRRLLEVQQAINCISYVDESFVKCQFITYKINR